MVKRLLAASLGAMLSVTLLPGVSQAVVSNAPQPNYPQFNDTVRTLAHRGSTVYVGGNFTKVTDAQGAHTRRGAAAIDIRTGKVLPWRPQVAGRVLRIVAGKEGVYLGGAFDEVRGKKRRNLALVSRTGKGNPLAWAPKVNGAPVRAIALSKKRVFIGGDFRRVDGKRRYKLASFVRGGRRAVTKWAPVAANGVVNDLARTKAGIYVAGEFRALDAKPAYGRLGLVSAKTGALVKSFKPGAPRTMVDVQVSGSRVFAAEAGLFGGGALAYDRADGSKLWERRFNGDVQALKVLKGELYAAGHFNFICDVGTGQDRNGTCQAGSTNRRKGLSLDPATGGLTSWNPDMNGSLGVWALDGYGAGERLLAAGDFTRSSTLPAVRFALYHP